MTAPSAPIDADLGEWDKISYFVLEEGAIWRTQNLADAGAAIWTKVFDAATQFTIGTFGKFLRLRCAPGTPSQIVYVLGYADDETAFFATKPFMLRSENNGLTWSQNWIDEALTLRDYTVNYGYSPIGTYVSGYMDMTSIHPRIGDDLVTYNPLAIVYSVFWDDPTAWLGVTGGANTDLHNAAGRNQDLDVYVHSARRNKDIDIGVASAALDDYFGAGNWTDWSSGSGNGGWDLPKESQRVNFRTYMEHASAGKHMNHKSWVLWDKPSVVMPKALDVARANPNVLFVGLKTKIITSTNGGFDWSDCVTAHGAYDICVDPQLGGVIYYWDTDGNLRCAIAGVPQTPLLTGETAGEFGGAFRIARDFNSGKLWAIHNGSLNMRDLGIWTLGQYTDIINGCGLRAFYASPTKLAFLDNSDIYLSLDAGATWAAKKGGWSAYADPRTIHLLEPAV